MQRLRRGHAHAGARSHHAVKARHADHLDDVAHATPFFAHHPGQRAAQFGLARCVGRVAHLLLQAQYLHRILAAVGPPARQQKTRQATGAVCQHQEGVAHWRRDKVLVADQLVGLTGTATAQRIGLRAVAAHVGAALFLGHRHTDGQAKLLAHGHVARVVYRGRELG